MNNSNDLDTLIAALRSLSSAATADVIVALILSGTVSMAVLQLLKELSPIRTWFQHRWIARWLASKVPAGDPAESKTAVLEAEGALVALATGGDTDAFYSLPAEQLVAQMNAAVQLVLDYPDQYRPLFMVLANGASADDIGKVLATGTAADSAGRKDDQSHLQPYLDARNRVGHRIQRNLDAIQISMANRWKLWLQYVCLTFSVVLIEGSVFTMTNHSIGTVLLGVPVGVLGGYLGPVLRDFVAALQKLRE